MFKKVAAIIVLVMVALLSVVGCTQTTKQNDAANSILADQQSSSPTPGKLAPDNLASAINARYKQLNYTIITPFTKTINGDHIIYKGTVNDGSNFLKPYSRNVTIELIPNREAAIVRFNASITESRNHGLKEFMSDGTRYYVGNDGSNVPGGLDTPRKVRIDILEPGSVVVLPAGGLTIQEYLFNADTSSYYQVVNDDATAL